MVEKKAALKVWKNSMKSVKMKTVFLGAEEHHEKRYGEDGFLRGEKLREKRHEEDGLLNG